MSRSLTILGKIHQPFLSSPKQIYNTPGTSFVAGFIGFPQTDLLNGMLNHTGNRFLKEGGTEFKFHNSLLHGAQPGKVILGIRPEEIKIGGDTVEAVVEDIEELGPHRLLYCRCGISPITVVDESEGYKKQGDRLSLGLPPSKVHLFDAENGRILNPPRTNRAIR